MTDSWDKIRRWRDWAEELRAIADQFRVPSAQDTLHHLAASYDKLAADAEARLTGREPQRS